MANETLTTRVQRLERLMEELGESHLRTEEQMRETDRRIREADEKTDKRIGTLVSAIGELISRIPPTALSKGPVK